MSDIAFQLEAIQLEWSSSNDSSLKEKPPYFQAYKLIGKLINCLTK